jgi:hypothetical protein
MRTRLALLSIAALSALGAFSSTASAAGQVCYDVDVSAAGTPVLQQSGCQDLPV